jgi:hypothetical protein
MVRIWENKKLNELQTYDRSIAIKAYREGYEIYATRALATSPNVDDDRLYSVDDIMNVEKAMFIIKEISMARLLEMEGI